MARAGRTATQLAGATAALLANLLQQQVDQLGNDDIPLSTAARPAAIHFIEALQYGLPQPGKDGLVKVTEEEYAKRFPDNWTILMRELDPTYVDPRAHPPAPPEPRRRSRLV